MSAILVLNAGSSSIKFALFDRTSGELRLLFRGKAETGGALAVEDDEGRNVSPTASQSDGTAEAIVAWAGSQKFDIQAVGHRVVHGGEAFSDAVRLNDTVVEQLHGLTPLAPLHQPACLAPIGTAAKMFPGTPQFASFDMAFHRTIPDAARRYALPRELEASGIRRYGFHGLSYAHVASCLPRILPGCRKVVAAHLGSGASLCAMLDGRSVDTTMGFSVLDGLVMATRPGLLDPGILLYLLKKGVDAEAIEDMLYHRSGLLGVSGLSGDPRELEESGIRVPAKRSNFLPSASRVRRRLWRTR